MSEKIETTVSLRRLPASETFFESLLESAPDAIIVIDPAGIIVLANRQAESMFGYSRDELLGGSIDRLLPERLRATHAGHRSGYVDAPRLRPMGLGLELMGCRFDGSEFPVEISLSPIRDGSERFISSVIRDVTQRKAMEAEIIAARKAAERANKANSAFLAAASHDLRQPVQAMTLLNGAMRRTIREEKPLAMLESQSHSLTAMTNLLNSLLDISRLDAGAVAPQLEEFSIRRVVERLFAEFSRQATRKGLGFELMQCNAVVRSDPNLVAEIIQNFVSNSIRYTRRGGIKVRCLEHGGKLQVQVCDTGIGIEKDQIERIFDEFHQVRTPGCDKEGFGLGLAIVRRLADLLGHEIVVESSPGKGSCFGICLPLVSDATNRPGGTEDDAAFSTSAGGASGLVLVIEDDAPVANGWRLLLEAEGYRVAVGASKSEALEAVSVLSAVPDLILSDYHLLDESTGVDAVLAVRQACGREIPAFIVSGDTSKVVEHARTVANILLMSKPVDPEELLRLAETAVGSGFAVTE